MVNNGSLTYDHDRDGTLTQLSGCEAKFRNVDHETRIRIKYENDVLSGMFYLNGTIEGEFKISCLFFSIHRFGK